MLEVELTQGQFALIDDEDYERVTKYKWHAVKVGRDRWYAAHAFPTGLKFPYQTNVYLHRFLMEPEDGMTVDHLNGNGLDCRRANMRVCTQNENLRNSKRSRLVSRIKDMVRDNVLADKEQSWISGREAGRILGMSSSNAQRYLQDAGIRSSGSGRQKVWSKSDVLLMESALNPN
jgi:hypothetical protein